MSKIQYYMVIASVLIGCLSGCGNLDILRTESDNISVSDSDKSLIKVDISEEDKKKIMGDLMISELMCFKEFEKPTDLHQDEAVYYCYILEHGDDEKKESVLFKKYNFDIKGETSSLPIKLVNELLFKYFNENDIKLFNPERLKYREEVLSINDEKVVIDNLGFGGGGRYLDLVDVIPDGNDYKFITNLVSDGGDVVKEVKPDEIEDGNYEYKEERGKKYKVLYKDGAVLEKREYKIGKHEDGSYYLKSMKILEKYINDEE